MKTNRNLIQIWLLALLAGVQQAAAQPVVSFTQPTNGQQIVTFSGLAGTAQTSTGTIRQVTFSIYNQSAGQYWNGTNFQGALVSLPTSLLLGTNWVPASGVALPNPCCGQYYQLTASATDSLACVGMTNITIQADSVPPVILFSPLTDGQTVSNLSAIGGSVTDNFNLVASVVFSIQEVGLNGCPGRWWNGTNFQASSVSVLLPAFISGTNWIPAAGVMLPPFLNSGQSYQLTATATDTTSNSASATITVTDFMTVLTWDPGLTPLGTVVLPNPNTNGGNYWFSIYTQTPSNGVWRTALNVLAGQAGVYMNLGSPPNICQGSPPYIDNIDNYSFASANPGSNGFVVDAKQFKAGQTWYIMVHATANAQWNLVTGDAFAYDLGMLAAGASSSTNASIGAEGMIFYKTTVPTSTLAWQLWINGLTNTIYVKKSFAPDPRSYDLIQAGQMLIVPPYLAAGIFNGEYFIGIPGSPGTAIPLDSRQQPIAEIPFNSSTNVVVTAMNFPYVTFQVQVPVQQIAWQLNLSPSFGDPDIAVRRDTVPNEFRNDAFSETPGDGIGASVTLVPPPPGSGSGVPGLSDGTWYVTVYSSGPYSCVFTNGNPVITDVDYVFCVTNDETNRVGWRYYRVLDIAKQLGTLGWVLDLANQVPGTEIAIRRNAVPGEWDLRDADDNYYYSSEGYVDFSSTSGELVQIGHQADVWYIGIYMPTQALGNFVLCGSQYVPPPPCTNCTPIPIPMAFDGTNNTVSVTKQPSGLCSAQFFQVEVPTNTMGWDVRLTNVTPGDPQMVVWRDIVPVAVATGTCPQCNWYWYPFYPWSPENSTSWPSTYQWQGGMDWTGDYLNPDGTSADISTLAMGVGNPLQAGTYYIGVYDPSYTNSYTLVSRGIAVTNYSIPVYTNLGFVGSATGTNLPPREAAYYQVVVPTNTPSWRVRLAPTNGDALLVVQQNYLPNIISGGSAAYSNPNGGFKAQKEGNEHYLLLPQTGQSTIPAGTYYVGVVSEGVNTNYGNRRIGSNTTSYALSSLGPLPVVSLGTASPTYDLLITNCLEGGDVAAYQFIMPGLESATNRVQLSVVLTELTNGNAQYWMVEATNVPAPQFGYGVDGGDYYSWEGTSNVLINPNPGVYTLSVQSYPSNTSYILQVHLRIITNCIPITNSIAFDGPSNTVSVTNQLPGPWLCSAQFFQVEVPSDTNLLGWDVRLINVTNGYPYMVVCRDILPMGLGTELWNTCDWDPIPPWWYTYWPSTYQWQGGMDWTGDYLNPDGTYADISTLAMGVGNPLQAGTYYIAVYDPSYTCSYTLVSRGIGFTNSYTNSFTNYSIPVYNLGFVGSTNGSNLPPREAAYYRVVVPTNTPSWRVRLAPTNGDALLVVQQQYLPNIVSGGSAVYEVCGWVCDSEWCSDVSGGIKMEKPGNQYYVLLPQSGEANIPAGTYYVGVVSEGVNSGNGRIGSDTTSYALSSGPLPVTDLGTVGTTDLLVTNIMLESEDVAAYHFVFPPNIMGMEVRLENRVGNPAMTLLEPDTGIATPYGDGYGMEGGQGWDWYGFNLITIPNPPATSYSLAVKAVALSGYVDAAYDLRVREIVPAPFNPDSQLNTNGYTNIVSGTLADTESAFFQVIVPTNLNGAPILGWQLNLSQTNGSPSVRVRQNLLPDNTCDTTAFASGSIIIAPPYLVPGTWYVEVKGSGNTAFSLASSLITTNNTMQRTPWTMPMLGQADTSPGLSQPVFGDTGVDSNGFPVSEDQGVDLAQGQYDFYAVIVPTNNAGLLHAELMAISGNPQLYIRVGAAPTPNHYAEGSCDSSDGLIDHQLAGSTTQYGSWVPLNGRTDTQLTPGIWVISVYAAGNANVRYRLILSSGNSATNGLVQDLPLDGSLTLTNQGLAGGDWRYYRVQIPINAPNNLLVTWTNTVGSPQLFVRDTVPPGDDGFISWAADYKNEGPYPDFISPGSFTLTTPPLRTGTSYYFGIWSPDDTVFSITCSTNGGTINVDGVLDFYCGSLNKVIASNSTLLYRIDVPPDATILRLSASNSSDLVLFLEQGTVPGPGYDAQWISYYEVNASLTESLTNHAGWPWLPGYSYYLAITNTSASAESFSLVSDGLAVVFLLGTGFDTTGCVGGPFSITNETVSLTNTGTAPLKWSLANTSSWLNASPGGGTLATNGSANVTVSLNSNAYSLTSGIYTATVWFTNLNDSSVQSCQFTLAVGLPVITTEPVDRTVSVGDSATFSVSAVGATPLRYFWRRNDTPIAGANGPSNTISNVQGTDSGSLFSCVVSNGCGTATSSNALLTVLPSDLAPVSVVAPATGVAGQSVSVVCVVTNQGLGSASGDWYDGIYFSSNAVFGANATLLTEVYIYPTPVAAGGSYTWTNSVTLPQVEGMYYLFVVVDDPTYPTYFGQYIVYESTKTNNTSAAVPITVLWPFPPTLTQDTGTSEFGPITNIFAFLGGSVDFYTAFIGAVTYQWYADTGGGYVSIAGVISNLYTLTNVQYSSAGNYYLEAINTYGSLNSTPAHLTTLAVPAAPSSNGTTNMYAYCVYTNHPWAYWRFEETTNTLTNSMQAYDYSGHNFDATYGNSDGTSGAGCKDGGLSLAAGIYGPGHNDNLSGFPTRNGCATLANGKNNGYLTTPPLNLNTNTVTFTLWIYINPNDNLITPYTGLLMNRNGYDAAGICFGGNVTTNDYGVTSVSIAELGYNWNNNSASAYNWHSGLYPAVSTWNFVACTITPSNTTMYLYFVGQDAQLNTVTNLFKAINNVTNAAEAFSGGRTWIGSDNWNNGNTFDGSIDEVAVFTNALSETQIQDLFLKALGSVTGIAPIFTAQPTNTTIFQNQTLTLTATASGIPAPWYQWQYESGTTWASMGSSASIMPNASTLVYSNWTSTSVTNFRCTATNLYGRATSSVATVTVIGLPIITCSNITVSGCSTGAVVNYTVRVSGGCPSYTTNCVPPSGSVFPIGTNTVNCCATDSCGQTNCCSFTVTVSPLPPLSITCSSNITRTVCSTGVVVNYAVTVSGGCPPITTNCVPLSGSVFPMGTTTVNCSATDSCGQSTNCSFTVTVSSPLPLSITCPGNITANGCSTGVVVNYAVTVSGGCPPITTNCVPPSGSVLPMGTTTVNCWATDSCGQSNCCSFTVTVSPPPALRQDTGTSEFGPITNIFAFIGGNVNFYAAFDSTLVITNQWLFSSTGGGYTNIAGATNDLWILTNVQSSSVGFYELAATNAIGSSNSTPAHLTALADPAAPSSNGTTNMYAYCVYTNHPWAYWRFEETTNTLTNSMQAYDYSGHNFDATYGNSDGTSGAGCKDGGESLAAGIYGPGHGDNLSGFPTRNGCATLANGNNNGYLTVPPLNLNTNTVTFTMWIYINPNDNLITPYTGLLMNRNGYDAAGIGFGGNVTANDYGVTGVSIAELDYTWNSNSAATYNWHSGLYPAVSTWNFVACVITLSNTTMYLDFIGQDAQLNIVTNLFKAVNNVANSPEAFSGGTTWIGSDNWNNGNTFDGSIDEVAVFTNAMTEAQIQDLFLKALGSVTGIAPIFTVQPTNTTIFQGQTLQLTSIASGIPNPAYQWQATNAAGPAKSWTSIPNNAVIGVGGATDSTLYMTNYPDSSYFGITNFRAIAKNAFGSATSSVAVVSLIPVARWNSGIWTVNFDVITANDGGSDVPYVGRGVLGTGTYWNALSCGLFANTPPSLMDDGATRCPVNLGATNYNGNWATPNPWNSILMDQYMQVGTNGTFYGLHKGSSWKI